MNAVITEEIQVNEARIKEIESLFDARRREYAGQVEEKVKKDEIALEAEIKRFYTHLGQLGKIESDLVKMPSEAVELFEAGLEVDVKAFGVRNVELDGQRAVVLALLDVIERGVEEKWQRYDKDLADWRKETAAGLTRQAEETYLKKALPMVEGLRAVLGELKELEARAEGLRLERLESSVVRGLVLTVEIAADVIDRKANGVGTLKLPKSDTSLASRKRSGMSTRLHQDLPANRGKIDISPVEDVLMTGLVLSSYDYDEARKAIVRKVGKNG